jgi:catechol 2,3-dioxygenase-like lactoylglutathione lyase family enzyme
MRPTALDHVAFWVADRGPIVARCIRHLGMHVIDEQKGFTLVGADARRGKLTFFDAVGPRSPGALRHVGLRVSDLAAAQALLPPGAQGSLELGEGLRVRLVEVPGAADCDLDHVALASPDPGRSAGAYERFGFRRVSAASVAVGEASLVFERGDPGPAGRPLLNHLGLLVDSADAHRAEAERFGLGVESVVDAANTRAVFVTGPDGTRIEYVEHKPTFSLA